MEGGVEHGHVLVGQGREHFEGGTDADEVRRVVQGANGMAAWDAGDHAVIDAERSGRTARRRTMRWPMATS